MVVVYESKEAHTQVFNLSYYSIFPVSCLCACISVALYTMMKKGRVGMRKEANTIIVLRSDGLF